MTFDGPKGLRRVGYSLYRQGLISYRYGIEGSTAGLPGGFSINAVKEMVNMITAFRTYEANQRLLATRRSDGQGSQQ